MASHRRKLKRIESPGHARYLTCSCCRRLPLLKNDRIKAAFVDHLAMTRDRLGFELYAWVLMPEHFHLFIMPDPPRVTITNILHALKRPFAARVLSRWRELDAPILPRITDTRGKTHFWQRGGGYDRNIVTAHELHEKVHYIHNNPKRRGLVGRAIDRPWSSLGWYEGTTPSGPKIDPLPT